MIRFALLLMVGGGFLIFFGCQEQRLSSASDTEPQEITAADLIANGVGENAHVKVTELYMLDNFVYESREDTPNKFEKVWVPAVSEADPYVVELDRVVAESDIDETGVPSNSLIRQLEAIPSPANFGIIIISDEVDSQGQLERFAENTEIQGLVINEIDSLDKEELDILRSQYPGMSVDKLLIIEHNRKPAGAGKTFAMIGGGVVLFLLGPGLFLMTRNS